MREGRGRHRVVWRSLDPPGVEYCELGRTGDGWGLRGVVARRSDEGPAFVSYAIEADLKWRTKKAEVEQRLAGKLRRLTLAVRGSEWIVNGRRDRRLASCVDVDLQASPVTNTLPIRRLRPRLGVAVEVTAAWVRFPSLKVEPLRQTYKMTGKGRYSYSSGKFSSVLQTDRFGIVRRYGDYWVAA